MPRSASETEIFTGSLVGGAPAGNHLPGRDQGDQLSSTNIEFLPGTNEVFAVSSGDAGGTWIYKFKGLAKGAPLYSHQ